MPQIECSVQIAAAPEAVFAAFSDVHNAPQWVPAIRRTEVLTPGPVGVGTRFRETRVMFGKEATETLEITAFDPPRLMAIEADSCGAHFRSEFAFAPEGQGTRVTLRMQTRAVSLLARLMSPLSRLMMGTMRKAIAGDMEAVRAKLESRA